MGRVETKMLRYQNNVVQPLLTKLVKEYFENTADLEDPEGSIAMMFLKNGHNEWLKFCSKKHPCKVEYNTDLFTQLVDKVILEAKNKENE